MSAIERCWCPDPLNYPHVIAVTKCASQASTQLRNGATPTSVFINAPRVPVRCGLLFGLPTRRLRDSGTGRAFRGRGRGSVVQRARFDQGTDAAARTLAFHNIDVPFARSYDARSQQEHIDRLELLPCVGDMLTDKRWM